MGTPWGRTAGGGVSPLRVAGATVLVGLLAGSSLAGCTSSAGTAVPAAANDEPETAARLAAFYQQQVTWEPCEKFRCAKLTVPVDYADPGGKTFTLPLIKAEATRPEQRIGTLVAGAGGPGQSGVSMVRDMAGDWPAPVRERFDIVGFDPRGVGGSDPKLRCEMAGEPTAEAPANLPITGPAVPAGRQFAEACLRHTDENVLRHLGTADVVSDLDVLRVATGQDKLTYVGYSYGTRIGQLYADRFPTKVRAMVLDGVDNVFLDWRDDPLQQAEGAEQALYSYARECAARTGKPCPGQDEAEIVGTVNRVLDEADQSGDGESLRADISAKLPFPQDWAELSEILIEAVAGESGGSSDDSAAEPEPPAESDDSEDALSVVNCLDRPYPTDLAAYEEAAGEFRRVSRLTSGAELLSCAFLPTSTVPPKVIRADGAPPVLLVGTTVDAATPYRWAQALSTSMPSATLLTNEDVGHAVYGGGASPCVDDNVNRYLIDLIPPGAHARCPGVSRP